MTAPVWDGTGVDPWLPARLDATLELAEAERTIWAAVWAALAVWLAAVAIAVLRGGRPDPQAVWSQAPAWTAAVAGIADGVILTVMGRAYRLLLEPGYRYQARVTVTAHLDEVRSRLADLPDDVYGIVSREIAEGANLGESVGQLADRVDAVLSATGSDRWQNRATTIARTEALASVNASRLDAATAWADATGQPLEQVWLATTDPELRERTREAHDEADGQRVRIGQPFSVGDFPMRFPGDPYAPPELVVNCVPGWIPVSVRAAGAMKRRLRGVLVELVTTDGHYLAATANHPVLTRNGWRPIGSLQPGDELLRATQARSAAGAVDPDVGNNEPSAHEAFRTVALSVSRTERMPSGFVDLDCDVADSEVEVPRSDLPLTIGADTEQLQQIGQLKVHGRHGEVRLADDPSSLLRVSHADQRRLMAVANRKPKLVQTGDDGAPADAELLGHSIHADTFVPHASDLIEVARQSLLLGAQFCLLTDRALLDTGILETAHHDVSTDAQLGSDSRDGQQFRFVEPNDIVDVASSSVGAGSPALDAQLVEACSDHVVAHVEPAADRCGADARSEQLPDFVADEVSSCTVASSDSLGTSVIRQVSSSWFDGHVYDFTTPEGLFLANNFVVHNCRCHAAYVRPGGNVDIFSNPIV